MNTNEETSAETLNEWHTDPSNWKLGLVYFNSKDKRIFTPKRFGIGWTINFASPVTILIIVVPILLVILLEALA